MLKNMEAKAQQSSITKNQGSNSQHDVEALRKANTRGTDDGHSIVPKMKIAPDKLALSTMRIHKRLHIEPRHLPA